MVTQTVRLPDELAARLEQLAKATRRSKSAYIVEALERHLAESEDLELALSRFRDPDAEWIEHDDVRRELGLD
jgi:RHH-type rel operon transcriptional repressor/antitoxin RelB